MTKISAGVHKLLKSNICIADILKTLSLIIVVRTFFEMLLESTHSFRLQSEYYTNILDYLHIYISWVCIFLVMAVLAGFFLKLRAMEGFTLTLYCFPLIISVPLFDFIFTKGDGAVIQYSHDLDTFADAFMNCLNPFAQIPQITNGIGVRLELLFVVIGSFLLAVCVFRTTVIRALLFSLALYSVVFIFGYLPALCKVAGFDIRTVAASTTGVITAQKSLYMYLPPFLLALFAIGYRLCREDKAYGQAIRLFLYVERLLFYILLLGFGFLIAASEKELYPRVLNVDDLLRFCSAAFSIVLLFVWAKIINDINDLDIDRISNNNRPLPRGDVSKETATGLAGAMLVVSLVFAVASEISFIFYWLFMWAMSLLYSAPPLRLRKYYPIGHGILACIGVSVFLSGMALVNSYDAYTMLQHKNVLLYIFAAFFFVSHIKDLKDMEGDKAAGVDNGWNYVKNPKVVVVLFLVGFVLAVCKLFVLLSVPFAMISVGAIVFFGATLVYVAMVKELRQLDGLLMFSLVFLIYMSTVWIYHISTRAVF